METMSDIWTIVNEDGRIILRAYAEVTDWNINPELCKEYRDTARANADFWQLALDEFGDGNG